MMKHPARIGAVVARAPAYLVALVALTACTMDMASTKAPEGGIGFRQARFEDIAAMREYRQCRDEGVALDEQARVAGSAARYLASARLLESCESRLSPAVAQSALDERMRAYGLSIQNYVKGGDIAAAQANLEKFKVAFAGYDLYYPDGSSFIETMELLVGQRDRAEIGQLSMLNVSDSLKSELRRARYWTRN